MTQVSFDGRARALTQALLTDAARVPLRVPPGRATSPPWKAIAVFAATALVISGAVVGASIALRSGSAKPVPASGGDWKSFQLPPMDSSLAAISCPDVTHCVAVNHGGDWFVSTDPGAGPKAWTIASGAPDTTVPPSEVMTGLSCVDRSRCFAVDESGYLTGSTSLGGSSYQFFVMLVDRDAAFTGISCPAPTLCFAVGGQGNFPRPLGVVLTFTFPAGGAATWVPTVLDSAHGLTAISCPTVQFCVATDAAGNVITSGDPSGGIGAWHVIKVPDADSFTAISCPTVRFCAAVDSNGQVVTSTNPAGGAGAWTITTLAGSPKLDSVSCPSTGFCVAGGLSEYVFVSSEPAAGSAAWARQRAMFQDVEPMSGLSCPSTRFCVGVDGGDADASTNPEG